VEGQYGLEATPEEHVERIVEVFREVRRVLRSDGTAWVNYGDCYATGAGKVGECPGGGAQGEAWKDRGAMTQPNRMPIKGLKPKDLVGMPWRIAFALQADGWWLRCDVVWAKRNCMPESVEDRPTRSHEYVFLLSKSSRYFYDATAVREDDKGQDHPRSVLGGQPSLEPSGGLLAPHSGLRTVDGRDGMGRNLRSVWWLATAPFPLAHFATFPPALVEPCIKAGTSEKGCCAECGAPWERTTETTYEKGYRSGHLGFKAKGDGNGMKDMSEYPALDKIVKTTGWRPTCDHGGAPVPCIVLDCFGGAGTVGLVADRLGRDAILIELNPAYARMAEKRIREDSPMFARVEVVT
jgi:DNA modification methylase